MYFDRLHTLNNNLMNFISVSIWIWTLGVIWNNNFNLPFVIICQRARWPWVDLQKYIFCKIQVVVSFTKVSNYLHGIQDHAKALYLEATAELHFIEWCQGLRVCFCLSISLSIIVSTTFEKLFLFWLDVTTTNLPGLVSKYKVSNTDIEK